MLSLVWFRRDLRVDDHPALTRAAAEGPVLPVYVAEPDLWAGADASGRHWAFLEESLRSLREDLARVGQPLILRAGEAVEVLARLQAKHRFTRIVTHPETGNALARARFARVRDWARGRGLDWLEVAEDQGEVLPAPVLPPVAEGTGALPGMRALGLAEDPCRFRQPGGRAAALALLQGWLEARGEGYAPTLATALGAERSGSRLSPYLAFGLLSAREVRAAVAGSPRGRALGVQLGKRAAALAAVPEEPEGLADTGAWAKGETGLPYVDAAMRALAAGGWLDGASRGLLASVGLHHLGLDPASVGLHLARLSTDHDPAILWREIARAGEGRVPDPVALGRRLDPEGAFLRRWLPELQRVPAAHLHAPWLWPPARRLLAGRYPEPVVDPANATREARLMRARLAPPRSRPGLDPLIEGPLRPARRRGDGMQMALDL